MSMRRGRTPRHNRYQWGMRIVVIMLLLFWITLSFALELLFTMG